MCMYMKVFCAERQGEVVMVKARDEDMRCCRQVTFLLEQCL